jgi:hypothetical protein
MNPQVEAGGTVTTIDDVRREYYEEAPWSRWIVELQLDPLVLIVSDDSTGALMRVPVLIDPKNPGEVEFGPDEVVLVQYITAPNQTAEAAKGGPGRRVAAAWATRTQSRAGMVTATWDSSAAVAALGDDPTAAQLKAMFALPGDTKTDSKLPHHDCTGGTVGAANTDGCSAGIGAINGARGGLAGVSDADKKKAYSHLAAHLTAAGQEPPELTAAAATVDCPECGGSGQVDGETCPECDGSGEVPAAAAAAAADDDVRNWPVVDETGEETAEAAGNHGPHDGEHAHAHSAFGTQGGDATHDHMHPHHNDAVHNHVHDPVSASPEAAASTERSSPDMEFTTEQLAAMRAKLGIKDGEELTPDAIASVFASTPAAAAGAPDLEPKEGVYLVDSAILHEWRERAAAGDAAVHTMHIAERDTILAAAIRDGKFPQARLEHYQRMWDVDPEGARKHVEHLAAGLVVPVGGPLGKSGFDPEMGGDYDGQQAYRELYPEDLQGGVSAAPGVRAAGGMRAR